MDVITAIALVWIVYVMIWLAWRIRPKPRPVVAPRRRRPDVPHALYYYAHTLCPGVIYIGISNDPEVRARRHESDPRSQRWLPLSTGVMVVYGWYPNEAAARQAERAAIRAACARGDFIANTVHVPRDYRIRVADWHRAMAAAGALS